MDAKWSGRVLLVIGFAAGCGTSEAGAADEGTADVPVVADAVDVVETWDGTVPDWCLALRACEESMSMKTCPDTCMRVVEDCCARDIPPNFSKTQAQFCVCPDATEPDSAEPDVPEPDPGETSAN